MISSHQGLQLTGTALARHSRLLKIFMAGIITILLMELAWFCQRFSIAPIPPSIQVAGLAPGSYVLIDWHIRKGRKIKEGDWVVVTKGYPLCLGKVVMPKFLQQAASGVRLPENHYWVQCDANTVSLRSLDSLSGRMVAILFDASPQPIPMSTDLDYQKK